MHGGHKNENMPCDEIQDNLRPEGVAARVTRNLEKAGRAASATEPEQGTQQSRWKFIKLLLALNNPKEAFLNCL